MNRTMKKILLLILLFYPLSSALAATYYVEDKGSVANNIADQGASAWSSATNIATPASAGTAMERAQAGDIVYFRGGTYDVGEDTDYNAVLHPENSGTEGSPITFQAYTDELPIINGTTRTDRAGCLCIGIVNTDWAIWDGFKVVSEYTGTGAPKNGEIFVWYGDHIDVKNCEAVGVTHSLGGGANWEGLRPEWSTYVTFSNCTAHGFRESSGNHNTSGYKSYHSSNVIIENCEFYDNTAALYPKSENKGLTVRYSWIHDNDIAVINNDSYAVGAPGNLNTDWEFYHNIFANNDGMFDPSNGGPPGSTTFYNNTVYATATGTNNGFGAQKGDTVILHNNIIAINTSNQDSASIFSAGLDYTDPIDGEVHVDPNYSYCDYNSYGLGTEATNFKGYILNTTTWGYTQYYKGISLATWQGLTFLDGGASPDAHSANQDPDFLNTSGNLDQIADFGLSVGSPCIGTGRYGDNIGANVSLVGTGATPATVPPRFKIGNGFRAGGNRWVFR